MVVRSGALTIPANSLVGGSSLNPFFEIAFTTPFVYHGGSLVVTLRHSDPNQSVSVDANQINVALPITLGNSVANFGSMTATTADRNGVGFYNVPVASFFFTTSATVPEPSSFTLGGLAGAIGIVFAGLRSRRGGGR
jgi:hypothetical protein